ncbi:MAG: S8 family serine peptidase, partial [Nanoarchaeota archaeon]|nr:S8 family serine peptidase [Nanoarchaeota archaeon]
RDAIDYAVSKDVLVVAATGNDGPELGSIDYPGANANVVAVAAVDWNANIAPWSSRGINDNDFVVEEREVELAAPGVSVLSTASNGCYAVMSGTSMATPHVAGLAAKLWQGSAASTRAYLQTLALDIDALGDDPASGFGLPIAP